MCRDEISYVLSISTRFFDLAIKIKRVLLSLALASPKKKNFFFQNLNSQKLYVHNPWPCCSVVFCSLQIFFYIARILMKEYVDMYVDIYPLKTILFYFYIKKIFN
ncbi:hypothetical protein ACKWTF_003115 [Chironomus riparius]